MALSTKISAPAYQQFSSPIRIKNYALSKQSQQKETKRRRTHKNKPLRLRLTYDYTMQVICDTTCLAASTEQTQNHP